MQNKQQRIKLMMGWKMSQISKSKKEHCLQGYSILKIVIYRPSS